MIVATAGHIDHGKTSLVKALTGVDADRLPEEKSRGITVDLGYAYKHLDDGASLGFVDVPGHEKLVRNMLSGAIGVDFVLLVVAADDGPMPQTREHLAIADLLGVGRGLVALTKADRVPLSRVAEVEAELEALLAGTSLAGAPILPCSSVTGEGIAAVAARLAAAAQETVRRARTGGFRLAIDRAFTLTGIGLIVTGTAHAGEVRAGDRLVLSPQDKPVRVRGLRSQNQVAESGGRGERCALNIVGTRLDKDDIHRGNWLLAPDAHAPTARLDVRLRLLASEPRALRHWTPVHVHIGAAGVTGRISLLEDKALEPGERALAQLVLDEPVGALHGDRFVIRDQSARRTMGGGGVIDPFAPKRGIRKPDRLAELRALDDDDSGRALAAWIAARPSGAHLAAFRRARNLTADEAEALWTAADLVVVAAAKTSIGVARSRWSALQAEVVAALQTYQSEHPDSPGATVDELLRRFTLPLRPLAGEAIKTLVSEGRVERFGQLLHLPGHEVQLSLDDENFWVEIRGVLRKAGLDQPRLALLAERLRVEESEVKPLLEKLARIGRLRRVSKTYFMLPDVVATLAQEAQRLADEHATNLLTVGQFREATGIGRNLTMPILEFFDKAGFTQRVNEGRRIRQKWQEIFESGQRGAVESTPGSPL